MDAIISYTRKVPIWKIILGIGFILLSIYAILFISILNGIVFMIMSFFLIKTDGSEINLESKTYRKTYSFLGIKTGKWEPLPKVEYITVFATTEDITVRALSAETTNSKDVILLNIFYDRNKKFTAYSTTNLKDAFDVASHIANALLIDLLDATKKGDYRWVDKDVLREKGEVLYTD
ncbi:hypothetical protein [Psychroserpens ponticola]|uniref:Uncharacterized protein n=1 Tax=Psychroserpens ponticola TaxID=2932268 RepID=A0ABY7RWG2_9FLAO|nr:hypothetical protein [Psychroserpens ponticola]WCO01481.1 hypothetical protein MUN68_015620 [Psychroserpens ponticola]